MKRCLYCGERIWFWQKTAYLIIIFNKEKTGVRHRDCSIKETTHNTGKVTE